MNTEIRKNINETIDLIKRIIETLEKDLEIAGKVWELDFWEYESEVKEKIKKSLKEVKRNLDAYPESLRQGIKALEEFLAIQWKYADFTSNKEVG